MSRFLGTVRRRRHAKGASGSGVHRGHGRSGLGQSDRHQRDGALRVQRREFDGRGDGDGRGDISCPGAFNICAFLTIAGQTLSFGAASVTYANLTETGFFNPGNPNRFVFQSLDPGFAVDSVALSTNIAGLTSSNVTLLPSGDVAVSMSGLPIVAGSTFTLELVPGGAAVPAPPAAVLVLAGLAGLIAARRRA